MTGETGRAAVPAASRGTSLLARYLVRVMAVVHPPYNWSRYLGRTEEEIHAWKHDRKLPPPSDLHRLLDAIINSALEPSAKHDYLREFWDLAARPLAEVTPLAAQAGPFGDLPLATLQEYLLTDRLARLASDLRRIPTERRAAILDAVSRLARIPET